MLSVLFVSCGLALYFVVTADLMAITLLLKFYGTR